MALLDSGATDVYYDSYTLQPGETLAPCSAQWVKAAGGKLLRILGTVTRSLIIGEIFHPAVTGYVVANLLDGCCPSGS